VERGVVLVTGGSRGIGASTAQQAAAAGWAVCLTYRTEQAAAASVVAGIEAAGGTAAAVRADMAAEADVLAAFAAADAMGPVGALVANAGISAARARVDELTAERRLSTRHGGRGGSVVLLSSAASRLGSPGEYVDYAASKGAVDTLGLGLAREVSGEGIRVNVVRPGIIETDIHASGGQPDRAARLGPSVPIGRAGRAGEIAAAVVWLLSDEASYCTGSVLDVAGGR
jgi:NAD(P)-dependent dehydrogenase (short-subunit alcohol dehydrogenase family)